MFDIAKARSRMQQADAEKRARRQALHEQAANDADRIIAHIIRHYHPKAVWQWGSVLNPKHFREYSDIDIAVEGIRDAETFFRLYDDAESMTKFKLDLIEFDKIAPEFQNIIRMKGKRVFLAENS